MKNKLYKQCELTNGATTQFVWLEADKIKIGINVTLEDSENEEKWWRITKIFDQGLEKNEIKDSHDSQKWYDKDHHRKLERLTAFKK